MVVPELSPRASAAVLTLARETVEASVSGRPLPPLPEDPELGVGRAVFVTLYRGGALRGCLGRLEADLSLAAAVQRMAVAAAREDPRFAPVTPDELHDLVVEVSVLSPAQPVLPEVVVPGIDGVIVRRGPRCGVLLPPVASQQGWDREQLLDAACRKAGLPPGAWREAGTTVEAFRALVIGPTTAS